LVYGLYGTGPYAKSGFVRIHILLKYATSTGTKSVRTRHHSLQLVLNNSSHMKVQLLRLRSWSTHKWWALVPILQLLLGRIQRSPPSNWQKHFKILAPSILMQHTSTSIIWRPLSTMQLSLERSVQNILYLQQLAMQHMPII